MSAQSHPSPSTAADAIRVLIASPDPVYARFLEESLRQRGMRVQVAGAGGEPDPTDFDVLLVEMAERGDRQWLLVEQVRDRTPLVEIVAITSEPLVDGAVEALRSGIFASLAYPVSDAQLAEEITAAHRRKRRAEQRIAELEGSGAACPRPEAQPRRGQKRRP